MSVPEARALEPPAPPRLRARDGSVPPGAYRHKDTPEGNVIAIDEEVVHFDLAKPPRDGFARRIATIVAAK